MNKNNDNCNTIVNNEVNKGRTENVDGGAMIRERRECKEECN